MKNIKLSKIFSIFALSTLAILMGILIFSMFFWYKIIIYSFNKVLLFFGMIIYMTLLVLFYKKVIPKLAKIKYLEYILFALIGFFTIFIGIKLQVAPTWDMGSCFEIAEEYVMNHTYTNTFYLSQFPNNTMMVVLDIILLKLFTIFNISNHIQAITVVTGLIITSAIIMGYYCMNLMYDRKKALLYLFICLVTTPFYLYSVEYYTDTFSMPIAVALLLLWLLITKCKDKKQVIILDIIYAIFLFVGFKLKLTCTFVLIAIILYELMQKNYKTLFKNLIIIIPISCVLIFGFNRIVVSKFARDDLREINEIPLEHWIMMGMNGNGSFSYDEYTYTNSNQTLSEKKIADRKKIIERITQRSLSTHLKNLYGKLSFAWHDGTFWSPEVLRRQPIYNSRLLKFVLQSGEYRDYYKYIPQIPHMAMLCFIFINIIRILKNKLYDSYDIITLVTTLGIMVFLLIWENRSRYLVNLLPIIIMSEINGITYVSDLLNFKFKSNKRRELCEKNINSNTDVL